MRSPLCNNEQIQQAIQASLGTLPEATQATVAQLMRQLRDAYELYCIDLTTTISLLKQLTETEWSPLPEAHLKSTRGEAALSLKQNAVSICNSDGTPSELVYLPDTVQFMRKPGLPDIA